MQVNDDIKKLALNNLNIPMFEIQQTKVVSNHYQLNNLNLNDVNLFKIFYNKIKN